MLLLALLSSSVNREMVAEGKTKVINIGIIVDIDRSQTSVLRSFVERLPYTDRLYFVINEWDSLKDESFTGFMKSRGELIPMFGYLQTLTPLERQQAIDHYLELFRSKVGSYPKGIFMFQPDTYAVNYAKDKYGVSYVVGYAFDQYLIDYMSMRGGWQAPYFGSGENILVPSKGQGIVVLPHLTWDWIARYTMDHGYNTHPQNAYVVSERDSRKALGYMKELVGQTLDRLEPFGYTIVAFEFKRMGLDLGIVDSLIFEYYRWVLKESGGQIMTPSDTVEWFANSFSTTPQYTITFRSPASGEDVEWLFNPSHRVARSGMTVKNLMDYPSQKPDPYLDRGVYVSLCEKPASDNQIDTSLVFGIDALGGGGDNPIPRDKGILYVGPLAFFPALFAVEPIYVLMLLVASGLVAGLAFRTARRCGFVSRRTLACLFLMVLLIVPGLQLGVIQFQKAALGMEEGATKGPVPLKEDEQGIKDDWARWARVAWRYFQPGVGVDKETGLHYANRDWARATDGDLSAYLSAVLDAEALGIAPTDGEWGADYRLRKALTFLISRPLMAAGVPFLVYDSTTGLLPADSPPQPSNPVPAGKILVSLHRIRQAKPSLAPLVQSVLARTNFEKIASDPSMWKDIPDLYAYLAAQGFKLWGLDSHMPVKDALRRLETLQNTPQVNIYGVELPRARITVEPLIYATFELGYDPYVAEFLAKVYAASEARYLRAGKLTAWSEGQNISDMNAVYVYQWLVTEDGSTWVVRSNGRPSNIEPAVFTKIAFALHATYRTTYTSELVRRVLRVPFDCGFVEGFKEDTGERLATSSGLRPILTDKTNALVISAARYALKDRASSVQR